MESNQCLIKQPAFTLNRSDIDTNRQLSSLKTVSKCPLRLQSLINVQVQIFRFLSLLYEKGNETEHCNFIKWKKLINLIIHVTNRRDIDTNRQLSSLKTVSKCPLRLPPLIQFYFHFQITVHIRVICCRI
jgi:hypothetical protein